MFVDAALLLIAGYFIIDAVIQYKSAAGTVWQRLLAAGRQSATILWARFTVIVAAVGSYAVQAADVLGAPGVSAAVQQYVQPKYVAALMVAVALITELARRRSTPAAPTA